MENVNFQPVFDYIDKTKEEILEEVSDTKSQVQKLQKSVDAIAVSLKNNEDKITVQEGKTERVEHWVMKAAEKIEVPYKP